MKYHVLWIDDESLKENFKDSGEFLQLAELTGIDINPIDNYNEGIQWLKQNKATCDAVILDVNCLQHKNSPEDASMDVFTDNIYNIRFICETSERIIPWFVYTGGGYKGAEALETSIPIPDWREDKKRYFSKPAEAEILFNTIKFYIDKAPLFPLKQKYKKELEVCPKHANKLLEIANEIIRKKEYNKDEYVTSLRHVMEWIKEYAKKHGVFSDKVVKLAESARFIEKIDSEYVPCYIQYTYTWAEQITQRGSHSDDAGSTNKKNDLIVLRDIRNMTTNRLLEAIFHNIMVLLEWCSTLPQTDEEIIELRKLTDNIKIQKDDITGEVKKNHNTYYCEDDEGQKCLLGYKEFKEQGIELEDYLGKIVTVIEVLENRYNKDNYPYYARKFKY